MATVLARLKCCHRVLVHLKRAGIYKYACSRRNSQFVPSSSNVLNLHDRGIFQTIFPNERSPDLYKALISQPQCFYCGFDPTADSLHVGHLLAIIALLHCQRGGHQVIAVLGGATAQIGDPSGRSTERSPLDLETINRNAESIHNSLHRIFTHHEMYFMKGDVRKMKPPKILNNRDWYGDQNMIQFLSTTGRHFRLGTMLGRHSVQSRLNSPEGMNFTEFCYQIFQAYDWLHLLEKYNCSIQIGGNDQTGNIVSGHDLIQRVKNKTAYGLTVPLVTSTTGDKLGKTAGNAVWLHPDRTSPFELYQYFIRLPDSKMESMLKMFTFYSDEVIRDTMEKHPKQPEQRLAQRKLAEHVTLLVHGEHGLTSARRCTEALYQFSAEKLSQLTDQELSVLFRNASTSEQYLDPGMTVCDLVMRAGCFGRLVDAERIIKAGGVLINHQRATEPNHALIPGQHILPNGITLIRKGKKNYYLVKWLGTGIL